MHAMILAAMLAAEPAGGTRLTDNMFCYYNPEEAPQAPDASLYSAEELLLVEAAMARLQAFVPLTEMPGDLYFEESIALEKRQGLEHTAAVLSDDPTYALTVMEYLADAPIFYEWEGMHEGPLAEAEYAAQYLAENPETIIEPFLLTFLLHRYRAAWECATVNGEEAVAAQALEAFTGFYLRAGAYGDPTLALVARELKEAPSIYMYADFPGWPR